MESTLIPGLSDDVAERCLGRVTWSRFRIVSQVSRQWKSFYNSDRCFSIRKLTGKVEQFMCVVIDIPYSTYVHIEIFDASGNNLGLIPHVPSPLKDGFRVEVLGGGKIMLIGGYTDGIRYVINTSPISALSNVYEFDHASNRSSNV
ncbi:unnamed protein product [Cochlearia groenlandica]